MPQPADDGPDIRPSRSRYVVRSAIAGMLSGAALGAPGGIVVVVLEHVGSMVSASANVPPRSIGDVAGRMLICLLAGGAVGLIIGMIMGAVTMPWRGSLGSPRIRFATAVGVGIASAAVGGPALLTLMNASTGLSRPVNAVAAAVYCGVGAAGVGWLVVPNVDTARNERLRPGADRS